MPMTPISKNFFVSALVLLIHNAQAATPANELTVFAAAQTASASSTPSSVPPRSMTASSSPAASTTKSTAAPAPALANSIATVGELIKIDNAQALEKARADAQKTGMLDGNGSVNAARALGTGLSQSKEASSTPIPPEWVIKSIYGQNGSLKAEITLVRSASHSNFLESAVGTVIDGCQITGITNNSVYFQPLVQHKKGKKTLCPTQKNWTGRELAEELRTKQSQQNPASQPLSPTMPTMPMGMIVPAIQPTQR